jgi:hypothetical protein
VPETNQFAERPEPLFDVGDKVMALGARSVVVARHWSDFGGWWLWMYEIEHANGGGVLPEYTLEEIDETGQG